MPAPLAAQLRRLSSERLARAAAALAACRPAALRNARLALADDDDPERGTYDENAGLELDERRAAAGAGAGGARSTLDAAPSTASTLLRSVWEGSRLAAAFLKRQISRGLAAPAPVGAGAEAAAAAAAAAARAAAKARAEAAALAAVAAAAAAGAGASPLAAAAAAVDERAAFSDECVWAFSRLYATLAAPRAAPRGLGADADALVHRVSLLNALAFAHAGAAGDEAPGARWSVVRSLWSFLVERCDLAAFVRAQAYRACARADGALGALALAATLLGHSLRVADNFELYERGDPLPLRELRHLARLLRDVVVHAHGVGVDDWGAPGARDLLAAPAAPFWPRFEAAAASALRALYERHSQRPLGPADVFVVDLARCSLCILAAENAAAAGAAGGGGAVLGVVTGAEARAQATELLLRLLPFAVPFHVRAERFERARAAHLRESQEAQPQVRVTVQRARLLGSATAALRDVRGDAMRRKVFVTFVNEDGLPEAGVDAGGLFKELVTQLAAVCFDADYGLWRESPQKELYPNPQSALCAGVDDATTFELLGRVLGKALYEGITVASSRDRFPAPHSAPAPTSNPPPPVT